MSEHLLLLAALLCGLHCISGLLPESGDLVSD